MNPPIDPDDALPDRPLGFAEVSELADIDDVEGVEPVVFRERHPSVVCFILVAAGVAHTFSWDHGGGGGWAVVRYEKID